VEELSPLWIGLAGELKQYLRYHPKEMPEGMNHTHFKLIGKLFLIEDIELYKTVPYEREFGYRVYFIPFSPQKFANKHRIKSFMYKITYKAYCNGFIGITNAKLIMPIGEA